MKYYIEITTIFLSQQLSRLITNNNFYFNNKYIHSPEPHQGDEPTSSETVTEVSKDEEVDYTDDSMYYGAST